MKKSTVKNINNQDFLEIQLTPVFQKDQCFYIGIISAKDLLRLYTVRPAQYDVKKHSSLAKSFDDDQKYFEYLIKQDEEKIASKDFQREYDKGRVSRIAKFLEDEEYPFFPNTIIATCDLINDLKEFDIGSYSTIAEFINLDTRPKHLSFFQENDGTCLLYIPYVEHAILVIDGQHRLRGLDATSEEIQDKYDLIISFIIGFDRSVIAQLFYTINYEQKSVNKSLLYHLTGEFSSELDEITFMHNMVKILNELDNSPFLGKIKMLGANPKDATEVEKRQLSISQAFLIDYFIKTISKSSVNSYYQPIFYYYFNNEKLQIEIIRFIIKYFNAVKNLKFNDWKDSSTSILTKGIGIGALIRVLHFLYVKLFFDEWNQDPMKITEISQDHLSSILAGLEIVDFSREGEFGGIGSGGSINKLSQRIVENVKYFDNNTYKLFFDNYKIEYLPKFKDWIKKNV